MIEIEIQRIKLAVDHPANDKNSGKAKVRTTNKKQPTYVVKTQSGYELVFGYKNLLAAVAEQKPRIKCDIKTRISKKQLALIYIIESYILGLNSSVNIGRKILKYREQYGVNQKTMAAHMGLTNGSVHHYESLVTRLAPELQKEVDMSTLTFKEARCITDLPTPERQIEVAEPFITGELSSIYVEKFVVVAKRHPELSVAEIKKWVLEHEPIKGAKSSQTPVKSKNKLPSEQNRMDDRLVTRVLQLAGAIQMLPTENKILPEQMRLLSSLKVLDHRIHGAISKLEVANSNRVASFMK